MNNKTIGIMGLVLVLGLVVIVSATINIVDDSGNVIKYSINIKLYPGWNLITATCNSGIDELQNANIQTTYAYSPKQNKYILTYHNGDFKEEGLNNMRISEEYLCTMPWWAYVTEETTYTYETDYLLKLADFELEKGWNFLTITPEIIGNSFESIAGNCEIETVYFYNAEPDEEEHWKNTPLTYKIPDYTGGLGMIIKVTNNCNLDSSDSTGNGASPPGLPEGTEETECIDSDEGKDYDVKGTATGIKLGADYFETYEDICLEDNADGNNLQEAFCINNQVTFEFYTCSNGCLEGVCV